MGKPEPRLVTVALAVLGGLGCSSTADSGSLPDAALDHTVDERQVDPPLVDARGSEAEIGDFAESAADREAPADARLIEDANLDARNADGGPTPLVVKQSSLQLWLTADRGLDCDPGPTPNRVTRWADQSSKAHHATPPGLNEGPRCNIAQHVAGGVGLPFFSEETNPAAGFLNVELGYLANSAYTVFVVSKVWKWPASDPGATPFLTAGETLFLGYNYVAEVDGSALLRLEIANNQPGGTNAYVASTVAGPQSSLEILMARFDETSGLELWQNGKKSAESTSAAAKKPFTLLTQGAIGKQATFRANADIAECIIYTAPLDDTERTKIETYLRAHWGL